MKARLLLLMFVLLTVLMVGCSDEQKKDAAALEQELLEREESGAEDSGATDTGAAVAGEEQPMDVAAVPEEETPEPVATAPVGSGWVVQVAACEAQDYAEYLVSKYTDRGYSPYITAHNHEGQMFYRVRLGMYDTQEEARQLKLELFDRYSIDGWIALEG